MSEEAKGQEVNKVDSDLGVSFEFVETGTSDGDDLLLDTSVNNADENFEENDLFKLPPGVGGTKPDGEGGKEKSIDEHFEELFGNKGKEPPATVDDSTKQTMESNAAKEEGANGKETSGSFLTVALAKSLQEQGFSNFDEEAYLKAVEEKGEAEAFIELIEGNIKDKTDVAKTTLDDYAKEYVKYREAGFTTEESQALVGNLETVNSITKEDVEGNENLQEQVIREVSKLRGMSQQEIDEDIQLLKDTDKLKTRGSQNLEILQKYHKDFADREYAKKQDLITQQKKDNETYLENVKNIINGTDEIIKDKKINQQTKDKLYDLMVKPIKKEDGSFTNAIWDKRSKNKIEFDMKLAYLIQMGIFDGATKNLTVDAASKATSNLKKFLENGKARTTGTPVSSLSGENLKSNIDAMDIFLED